jgi:hypothetical protein
MTQTLVGLLRTHRPRGWPLAYKSLLVPGLGKVSQVTSVIRAVLKAGASVYNVIYPLNEAR